MSRQTKVFGAWLISGGAVIAAASTEHPVGLALAGIILIAWGLIIGLDYRGLAASMPPRLLGFKWTVTNYRVNFAFFGLVGLVLLVAVILGGST